MIFSDSRYANGEITNHYNPTRNITAIIANRIFPVESSQFIIYIWNEKDRIDLVSYRFLGNSEYWWKIMDYNPELANPIDIPVGTTIRIPRE